MEEKQPFWNENYPFKIDKEPTPEPQPERYLHNELECLIGQYAIVLSTMELAPDWKMLYEERHAELVEQLRQNKGAYDA
jgi:hypothetical protein